MGTNRSLLATYLLRTGVAWALRQILGLLAIAASVILLLGAANVAEAVASRWSLALVGTALGVIAWLMAALVAYYALTRLLRLPRQRSVGLWLWLVALYAVVVWVGGGFPLVPEFFQHGVQPATAAERPMIVSEGSGTASLVPLAGQVVAPPTRTPTRSATVAPSVTPLPLAVGAAPLWARNTEATPLWSDAGDDAEPFTSVPAGAYFRILSTSDARYKVYYGGDRARRQPGEAWVDKTALSGSAWPQFIRAREALPLLAEPREAARQLETVPSGSYLEVIQGGPGDWARVLYLGNGRDPGPRSGWVSAAGLGPTDVEPGRIGRFLATASALVQRPEVWLRVPYRSQLDGSSYAAANCGPTSVAMVLDAHGIQVPLSEVRRRVMAIQRTPNCDECGSFIESLAGAVEQYGLKAIDLQGEDGKLRRWSLDDVRAALRAGHPVVPQVKYRQLPGREDALYYGDHYIVVTGILGDSFLYNDPIDDGPGYGRVIRGEQLRRAMAASDFPLAAFASGTP